MAAKVAVLLFLWAVVAHAAVLQTPEDADKYCDELLKLGAADEERDRADLEDLEVDIEKNIFVASFKGSAKMTNGSVSGINGASRYAPSKVTANPDNTTTVQLFVEYANLQAVYESAEITLNGKDMNGIMRVSMKQVKAKVDLTVDDVTGAVTQDNFAIRQVKATNFKLQVTGGLPIFGPAYAAFEDIKTDVKGLVNDVLADSFRELVQGQHEEEQEA